MKRSIYAIYDTMAGDILGNILQAQHHDAVAIRDFSDIVLQPNSRLAMHPDDFVLVELGEIDTGESQNSQVPHITAQQPRIVATAAQIITLEQERTREANNARV